MLFDPAHASFEFANQDSVAYDRRMVLHNGAAQPNDLFAQFLAG